MVSEPDETEAAVNDDGSYFGRFRDKPRADAFVKARRGMYPNAYVWQDGLGYWLAMCGPEVSR